MTTTRHIILDKNFVQGSKAAEVIELCKSGRAVMPDVLFYEMVSSPEPGRSQCFAKFPGVDPVVLVPSVGELLRFELQHRVPCGKPSAHAKKDSFQFHSRLADGSYVTPEAVRTILREAEEDLASDVMSLIQMMDTAPNLFPAAFAPGANRTQVLRDVGTLLATQPSLITGFYASLQYLRT